MLLKDLFAVVFLVTWHLNESESGGDLIYYHRNLAAVSIKARSPPASLSFKGQATKHTTAKWSIAFESRNSKAVPFQLLKLGKII